MNNLVDLTSIIQLGGVVPLENINSGDVILFKTNNGEEKYGFVIVDENGRKQALASYEINTVERIISANGDDDYEYYVNQLNTKGYIEEPGAAAVPVPEIPIEIDNQLVVVCHCNPSSKNHHILYYYTKNFVRLRELGPTVKYVDPLCTFRGDTWENIKGLKKYVWGEHCPIFGIYSDTIGDILIEAYKILEVGGIVIFRVYNNGLEPHVISEITRSGFWTFDIVDKNSEKIPFLISKDKFEDKLNTHLAIFTKQEISQSKRPKIDEKQDQPIAP